MRHEGGHCPGVGKQRGDANMLTYKIFSAFAAAALGAAVVLLMPGFSPSVEAGSSIPVVKSDRLDYRPLGTDCSQQAWPYYQANCVRDRTQAAGQARAVRLVSTDRLPQ